jgi:DNA-binding response OmpR family regulator
LNQTETRAQSHILVLDDDPALVRVVRLALLSEGFTVAVAVDGVQGLEMIEANGYDLLVLDLQMPRMDGRTFYRELRARGFNIPVLLLSAFGAHAARRELMAEDALDKPFDTDDLVSRIRDLLAGQGREA